MPFGVKPMPCSQISPFLNSDDLFGFDSYWSVVLGYYIFYEKVLGFKSKKIVGLRDYKCIVLKYGYILATHAKSSITKILEYKYYVVHLLI